MAINDLEATDSREIRSECAYSLYTVDTFRVLFPRPERFSSQESTKFFVSNELKSFPLQFYYELLRMS